ncbi:MAG: dephospho-CoA kinase [Candidatus Omnitrophica bacterium]|nr:dephospho-CoA kinase [Candidatus Omnitrophota bacterium]
MLIGVTGNYGSGKTTVAGMFAGRGAFVIDADKVCHSLMGRSMPVYKKIIKHFGAGILDARKNIDRRALAEIVFSNRSKLDLLNRSVHPSAIKEINKIIRRNKKRKIIIVDAALLIESDFYKNMDKIIVVKAVSRKKDSLRRIRMQASFKKKLRLADFTIDNSGSKKKTLSQVRRIWKQLSKAMSCENF